MNPTVKKVDDSDHAKCLEIARDLSEWFNKRGIDRMAVDLRAYEHPEWGEPMALYVKPVC